MTIIVNYCRSLAGTNLPSFALLESGFLSHSVSWPRFITIIVIIIIIIIIIICIKICLTNLNVFPTPSSLLRLFPQREANICQKKNSQILVAVLNGKIFSNGIQENFAHDNDDFPNGRLWSLSNIGSGPAQ